jgi:hypothetical protein
VSFSSGHRSLVLLAAVAASPAAWAGSDVAIWMEPSVPEPRVLSRADTDTGGTAHLAWTDLSFPPAPPTAEDEAEYVALSAVLDASRAKWAEFEVEQGIARDIDAALSAIDVIRNEHDRDILIEARLLQAAAIARAFEPEEFGTEKKAADWRLTLDDRVLVRAWLDAAALTNERRFNASDLVDGTAWADFRRDEDALFSVESAQIDLSTAPPEVKVVVDGREVPAGQKAVELIPGQHWVHVIHHGKIAGRKVLRIEAGQTVPLPREVSDAELADAKARVIQGTTTGLPAGVKAAAERLKAAYGGAVFLGATDERKYEVVPYLGAASLQQRKPVTFLGVGEVGGGFIMSPIFNESNGDVLTAPAVQGGLGFELGIYNFALIGGFDVSFTPSNTVTFGSQDETENRNTPILPQAWGGLGGYILRPVGRKPSLLAAATFGWNGPAHLAAGGRLSVGIPLDDHGTWWRFTFVGNHFPSSMWDTGSTKTPMTVLMLRTGLGAQF